MGTIKAAKASVSNKTYTVDFSKVDDVYVAS